jgi:hypothetical protein
MNARHAGRALADGAIDAQHVRALLVQDGVDRDGGLARLAIAEDQLALAAPDGNQRIDDLEPGLQRLWDRGAVHDGSGRPLDGNSSAGGHRPFSVEGPAQRVDDAPEQSLAHGHVHDPAGPLDFVSRMQVPVFAQQNDADFIGVDVERDAKHVAGKLHQLVKADAGEPGHLGDAGSDAGDRAHLPQRELRRVCLPRLAHAGERAVESLLQARSRLRAHGPLFTGASGFD